MPFNETLTSEQRDIVDSGGYYGRSYIIFDPCVVVLQCHPAANVAEDVIAEFAYDSVITGDYTDVREGMVVIISSTSDYRNTKLWRGRIRELPTSDGLYINESSIALDTSHYVTVIDTSEPMTRLRSGNLVDWNIEPEGLQPLIKGLQSAYLKEPDAMGEAEFTFAPVGQALADGATIDDDTAWEWEIDGTTYDTREVTVTLTEGHYWARVWLTDDQPVTSYFVFQIIVANEDSAGLVRLSHDGYEISSDWDNGWNGSVTYFAGIEDVLDRTRVVIVSWHAYRDGDPGLPNISFVGYLRREKSGARGDENYSTLADTDYNLAGFKAIAGEMPFSPIAIRNVAAPTLWDEINLPTTERAIAHILTRYTNLLTLCALDFGEELTNDHFGGDMDASSSSPMDACDTIASEINAQLIFAPSGEIILRRHACFLTTDERNDLDVMTTPISTDNMVVIDHQRPHVGNLAQIQVGCRTYYTADGSNFGVTGTAPAVAYADGMDFDTAPNQLLTADATQADAKIEAGERAGHLLAYRDDAEEFTLELDSGWAWLVPSQHQWWSADVPASVLTSGRAFTESDRLLLKSITHKYNNERGTRVVNVTFRRETTSGLAAVRLEVVPSAVTVQIPIHPPLSAYLGGFPPASSLRLPSLTPAKRQPYKPRHAAPYMPLPPQVADEISSSMGQSGCFVQNPPINFRNPSNVATNFLTVLSSPYTIAVKGSAQIGSDSWLHHSDSASDLGSLWAADLAACTYDGTKWNGGNSTISGTQRRTVRLLVNFTTPTIVTRIDFIYSLTKGTVDLSSGNCLLIQDDSLGNVMAVQTFAATSNTTGAQFIWTGEQTLNHILVSVASSRGGFSGACTISQVRIFGYGANDLGESGVAASGDAFYWWTEEDMSDAQLYTGTQGLIIDNSPVAVPPIFNPNHEYALAFTGTGNTVLWRFAYPTQSQAENKILYAMICGPGAGN